MEDRPVPSPRTTPPPAVLERSLTPRRPDSERTGIPAGHAGFFTTLPSSQTTKGSLSAMLWLRTFLAARRNARSARSAKAGNFVVLRPRPWVFMNPSSSHPRYHERPGGQATRPAQPPEPNRMPRPLPARTSRPDAKATPDRLNGPKCGRTGPSDASPRAPIPPAMRALKRHDPGEGRCPCVVLTRGQHPIGTGLPGARQDPTRQWPQGRTRRGRGDVA